jgi:hypothetical protein
MSRRINVNPAHYKVAGRERQGEDIIQHLQKQAFGAQRAEMERWQSRPAQSAPGWEDPAQPTADPEPDAPRKAARPRRANPRRKPARGRKTAPSTASRRSKKRPATRASKAGRKASGARRPAARTRRARGARSR